MEQKDYLLREIEKMGSIFRAIINLLKDSNTKDAVEINSLFKETKDLILGQTNFDLEKFLSMNETESKDYISTFEALSNANKELLANLLYYLGRNDNVRLFQYFTKALFMLNQCKATDKSYSVDRELLIKELETQLSKFD